MTARPSVIKCSALGGTNPKTGRRVGERHRWGGGAWGVGRCDFCGRYLEDVLEKPNSELTLAQALHAGEAKSREGDWHPSYWKGDFGIAVGWYVKRLVDGQRLEWLNDAAGSILRFDSETEALKAVQGLGLTER